CNGTTYDVGTTSNPKYFGIDKTLDKTDIKLYAVWTASKYDIILTNTNATTTGSTSAYTTYNSSNVYAGTASSSGTSTITSPQRAYSFSGFSKTNSAYNATVTKSSNQSSATSTITYTYTFDGWYTASSGGYKVINSNGTLVANAPNGTATLTNSSSQWISTSGTTLYAHWTAGTSQTLPTITQTDSTNGNGNCYWSSTNSTTGAQTYASGATISGTNITAGATLYGVCKFPVKITFAGTGVSSVAVKSGSTTGTTVGTVSSSGGSVTNLAYGTTYYLVPTYTSTSYTLDNWKKTSAKGALAGTTTQNTTTTTATPTLTIGTTSTTGSVGITITGKSSCTSHVTFSGYMQSMSASTVTSACVGDTGTLTDRRDSKTYTVKKLADGNLWMTENLAIDLTATSYDTLYGTGTNAGKMTNATSEALQYLKGTKTGTSSDQWAMSAVKKTWTTSYSYSQPWIAVDSSTSGVCNNAYCVNSDKSWSSTSVTSATINGTTSIAQGKIGVYYNYCAASAGSYCWGNYSSTTGSPSSDPNTSSLRDITSDICPYGWRLPTSSSSGEYKALYTAYSSNATNFQTALVTPLSGYFSSGKAYYQGNRGIFWSSTWSNTDRMYYLYVSSSSVLPSNNDLRNSGNSVRCLLGS
ncbi:hypothetical protein IJG04_03015, partial [Candidatus Saccharibacteria bacterium]|nr:hypothetical protein [Candidatus Saccharibacteria bacterium]